MRGVSKHNTRLTKLTKDICGLDERVSRGSELLGNFSFSVKHITHLLCFISIALLCHSSILATHITTHTYIQTIYTFRLSAHGRAVNQKAPAVAQHTHTRALFYVG